VRFGPDKSRLFSALAVGGLIVGLSGCGGSSSSTTTTTKPVPTPTTSTPTTSSTVTPGPENVPLEQGPVLAPASSTSPGTTVDGIQCAPLEQLKYHIHAHLQVYVNGLPRALPGAIGMLGPVAEQTAEGPFYGAQKCYYWLHTHTYDGIIHIESPTARIYTLGNFFDEWHQPLSSTQVASDPGRVTAIFNGKPWTKDVRDIPLIPHATIQLAVGSPIPPYHAVDWGATSL
jgi:hypothetical protein